MLPSKQQHRSRRHKIQFIIFFCFSFSRQQRHCLQTNVTVVWPQQQSCRRPHLFRRVLSKNLTSPLKQESPEFNAFFWNKTKKKNSAEVIDRSYLPHVYNGWLTTATTSTVITISDNFFSLNNKSENLMLRLLHNYNINNNYFVFSETSIYKGSSINDVILSYTDTLVVVAL